MREKTIRKAKHPPLYQSTPRSVVVPLHTYIHLERSSSVPLYKQISDQIREVILSGELGEGSRLPTERALAQELNVNRTTIMNAYNELAAEGLIEGHVGRGTVVKRTYFQAFEDEEAFVDDSPSWLFGLSSMDDLSEGPQARVLSDIASMGERENIISLASATPPPDMLPAELIQSIMSQRLAEGRQSALGYCPVEGLQSLRRALASHMRKRGVPVDFQHILVLSGSTQGIGLIGRFLLHPGDEVVVEVPTYLGAIQTFRALGARIIGIPVDKDGMRVDLLEAMLARRKPRLIYVLPTFQNPTGVVMSLERRKRLLALARRYQVPILEDDPYGEIYFENDVPQPLKALDTRGHVLYLSTCSKILAPGLRVAWLAAAEPLIEMLSLHKQVFDLNTNALGQWLVSEMLRQNVLSKHLETARALYHHKRDLMLDAIKRYWPVPVRIHVPDGGFHLWCHLPGCIRARALLRESIQEQVTFVLGEPFHVDGGGHQHIRLSFASASEDEIVEGIRRIGLAMQRILARHVPREEQERIERFPVV
ncbi:DNA-binding transcriptional MocR family regulator [Thermosporothrix hazakensis]|uniref:DNA-binding transcriptional MocR family regulator n=2 Tax=Thermosporothrix TaxID=768650 RepID=A0A326UFJ5_THEHA|nr:PLP-dependent aminotransferase family protein [Thermosporothrix hazakensis]PZW36665.1 DNA-binding transcriptional MocR family regulator [Thermosporothrix hazakensis]BBH89133.1 GntR family transcriptional regulator [Thermosporothrix sp. COM3]GCE47316.1 GntR family transcriptional regulator [Thermosporothrix hazakensis]